MRNILQTVSCEAQKLCLVAKVCASEVNVYICLQDLLVKTGHLCEIYYKRSRVRMNPHFGVIKAKYLALWGNIGTNFRTLHCNGHRCVSSRPLASPRFSPSLVLASSRFSSLLLASHDVSCCPLLCPRTVVFSSAPHLCLLWMALLSKPRVGGERERPWMPDFAL